MGECRDTILNHLIIDLEKSIFVDYHTTSINDSDKGHLNGGTPISVVQIQKTRTSVDKNPHEKERIFHLSCGILLLPYEPRAVLVDHWG